MAPRAAALLVLFAVVPLAAQAPVFDVASIKPHADGPPVSTIGSRNGTFNATNMTVRGLVAYAYALPPARIVGGPAWVDADRFDITARPPIESPATINGSMDRRLRALLADRFQLAARSEMREATVYSLVRSRTDRLGPQLKPSAMDCNNGGPPYVPPQPGQAMFDVPRRCTMSTVSDGKSSLLRGGAQPLDELARNLAVRLAVPVSNKTGLTGVYDFDLRFTPDAAALSEVAEWPTLMTAIQEQLGLTLEPAKAPIEFIVIDRVEHPSAN